MILADVSGTVVEIVINLERVYLKIDRIFLYTNLSVWTLLLKASILRSTLYTSAGSIYMKVFYIDCFTSEV